MTPDSYVTHCCPRNIPILRSADALQQLSAVHLYPKTQSDLCPTCPGSWNHLRFIKCHKSFGDVEPNEHATDRSWRSDCREWYVKLSLSIQARQVRGAEVWRHSFLISALNGGKCSASLPSRFISQQRWSAPIKQWVGWAHVMSDRLQKSIYFAPSELRTPDCPGSVAQ